VEAVTLQFLSVLVIYKDSLHWYIMPISTTTRWTNMKSI